MLARPVSRVNPLRFALVSTRPTVSGVRLSVESVLLNVPDADVHVADLDGSYRPAATEHVRAATDLGLDRASLHRSVVAHGLIATRRAVHAELVNRLADGEHTVVAMTAGVVLFTTPSLLVAGARADGVCVIARSSSRVPRDGRWPSDGDLAVGGLHAVELLAVHGQQDELVSAWRDVENLPDDRWLDVALSRLEHRVLHHATELLSPWNLTPRHHLVSSVEATLALDGRPVVALDLTRFDPARPWLLAPASTRDHRARLSEHLELARYCAQAATWLAADATKGGASGEDLTRTSLGFVPDALLRDMYLVAEERHRASGTSLPPDPIDPGSATAFADWLATPVADGVLGRYLLALHSSRQDLRSAFPGVPGEHTGAFLNWARDHGREEPAYPADVVDLCVRRAHPPEPNPPAGGRPAGVNVVGYLRGELGIGESARLMLHALDAAHVSHRTISADRHLTSRQGARLDTRDDPRAFDVSLLCVNADMTAEVARTVPALLAGTYRIGMWYWEVEEFPAGQHGTFAQVDEIWVATDFVRDAIEPHSPVPVRVLTPPLPQPRPVAAVDRSRFGLPDRPVFLFSFDYLSTVERKNPLGLVDAFTRAFAPGEGPVLVLKSINADQRPDDAERLRVRTASEPDVILIEKYLDADDRDALLAASDVYVSLHRAEGLGLTMAEAMAQGKPVIATGYSGNMQFMTEENSFLVPWTATPIPPDAPPYPAGARWADPDLDAAAALMRRVIDEPAMAAAHGAKAASDIREHSAEAAGRRIASRLEEIHRTARRRLVAARIRGAARRVRGS